LRSSRRQIKILENLISVAYKQYVDEVNGDGLKAVRDNLENAKHSFSNNDLVEAQGFF